MWSISHPLATRARKTKRASKTGPLPAHYLTLNSGYQNYLEVADVRAGRPCVDEIVQRVKKRVGIVVGQKFLGIESALARPADRGVVDDRARRIGGTVDAIGADAC